MLIKKNNIIFRAYIISLIIVLFNSFLHSGDVSLLNIQKYLYPLAGSVILAAIYQITKNYLIAYLFFFISALTLMFNLSKPMTGMYVDSSNLFLFGLSFYSLSLGYKIYNDKKLNFKDLILASNPLILFTGPIATFYKDFSKTSFLRRFNVFFPYLILGVFFYQIIGIPLTKFFFLIDSTNILDVISFGIIFELFIYFNFAGLSLIVYALLGISGLGIPLNFRQPFSSRNLIDFWRGWHTSLSAVLKKLFYIPLRNKFNGSIALIGVFLSSAMWHGVTMNFIFWGSFHAACFIVTKFLLNKKFKVLPIFLMIFAIVFGRILFLDSDISRLLLKLSFNEFNFDYSFLKLGGPYSINSYLSLILALLIVFSEFIFKNNRFYKQRNYKVFRLPIFQLVLLIFIFLFISSSNGINFAAYGQR